MDIYLHTIALEPQRWLPQRVQRPLLEIIPAIAAAGFSKLEVFEPHLTLAPDEVAVRMAMREHGLEPIILSSYLDINPERTNDEVFARTAAELLGRVQAFEFRAVRIFPVPAFRPGAMHVLDAMCERIGRLANLLPAVDILLETHDGSLADDPPRIVELVQSLALPNVHLAFQPTEFTTDFARKQWQLQKPYVRHLHLQNRWADRSFAPLAEGVIDWREILVDAPECVTASLEFVPTGICPPEEFSLERTIAEAKAETEWAANTAATRRV